MVTISTDKVRQV